ncbi:MAG: CDP-diacylglycerol--serine O-phosphatidyltransferase [Candidatus Wallbacteria bacterium]|nr:CDP-diacylglycerol--serine O-phosphatidyltransferase [Candidatus Wallbacteria bacterium]
MRGIYVFPNLFTAANLAFGFTAIALLTVDEPANLEKAAWFILFANVFDAMDGRVARMLKSSSQFGEEFDSLADLISFGVAPACLMLKIALGNFGTAGLLVALLYVICGAARLARFNVMARSPNPPSYFFVGCPIPAASTFLASCALYDLVHFSAFPAGGYLAMTAGAAFLMISTVPYPKKKKSEDGPNTVYFKMAALAGVAVAMVAYKQDFIFLIATLYISSGIVWKLGRDLGRLSGYLHRRHKGVAANPPGH